MNPLVKSTIINLLRFTAIFWIGGYLMGLLLPDLWVSYSPDWETFEVCHFPQEAPFNHRDCDSFYRSLRPLWVLIGFAWLWYAFRLVVTGVSAGTNKPEDRP